MLYVLLYVEKISIQYFSNELAKGIPEIEMRGGTFPKEYMVHSCAFFHCGQICLERGEDNCSHSWFGKVPRLDIKPGHWPAVCLDKL